MPCPKDALRGIRVERSRGIEEVKLFGTRMVSPLQQNVARFTIRGRGGPAPFLGIGPRPDFFPAACHDDQRKISEEPHPMLVLPDEVINTVLDFLNGQDRELAVGLGTIKTMLEKLFVFRSLQQQGELRTSAFRRNFRGTAKNLFAFFPRRGQFLGRIDLLFGGSSRRPIIDNLHDFPIEASGFGGGQARTGKDAICKFA